MNAAPFLGLEILATAVIALDEQLSVIFINPAAENLFSLSAKHVQGHALQQAFSEPGELLAAVEYARHNDTSFTEHDLSLATTGNQKLQVSCTVTPVDTDLAKVLLEFHPVDQQLKIVREERMEMQSQANRELIRNLAHEIRNPLGGIRGAAQLLEHELPRPNLREYTQVIIKESDRLQSLMDRLLTPHRLPQISRINIHEVLERVRSLLLAETSQGIKIQRDYDTSIPELEADKEQLIQAVLNIARNAVQAMQGKGQIVLRTRIARQATVAKKRYRLAVKLQIIDDGPGIPEDIRESIFYPLVSGREGGSGVGLTLAQTFVTQHHGTIECDSRPGYTCFTLLLPLPNHEQPLENQPR
jgi:two-component system nitrogen regulation sensor histidine kinase GlnL